MYAYTLWLTGIADQVIQSGIRVRVNAPTWSDAHRLAREHVESYGYTSVVVDDTHPDGATDGDAGVVSS